MILSVLLFSVTTHGSNSLFNRDEYERAYGQLFDYSNDAPADKAHTDANRAFSDECFHLVLTKADHRELQPSALITAQHKIAEKSYLSFTEDCDALSRANEEMVAIQGMLPEGMGLWDTPPFGRCGFWAILAIRFVMDHPNESTIVISGDGLSGFLKGLAEQIRLDLELVKRSPGDQSQEARERIEILRSILERDEKYVNCMGDVMWGLYYKDIVGGKVEMDCSLSLFVNKVLGFAVPVVSCKDGNALRNLGNTAPNGALIHHGVNHFMVAFPKITRSGVEVNEIRYQELNGRWWTALPRSRVVLY
jgi:hypothetical protein